MEIIFKSHGSQEASCHCYEYQSFGHNTWLERRQGFVICLGLPAAISNMKCHTLDMAKLQLEHEEILPQSEETNNCPHVF